MAQEPFPAHVWWVALRDTLRWILAYKPPPGEAVGGELKLGEFEQPKKEAE